MRAVRLVVGALASLAVVVAVVLMATLGSASGDHGGEPVQPMRLDATTVVVTAPPALP
jgi:Flp pilus assembly protein CpaB